MLRILVYSLLWIESEKTLPLTIRVRETLRKYYIKIIINTLKEMGPQYYRHVPSI